MIYTQEQWNAGDAAWFEYHCWESNQSSDAPAWYHSHQQVTVLRHDPGDHDCQREYASLDDRAVEGLPCVYRVRFADGLEWDVFEDELLLDRAGFERPDPLLPIDKSA